ILIHCGLVLYQKSKLTKDTGILNVKCIANLTNPNIYNNLLAQLAFKIPSHQTPTIKYPELYKSSQGKSRLPDQESLVYVLKQHTERKPVQIDLTYQHPNLNHEEILKDEDSDLDPCPPESSVKRRHYFSTDPAKARNQDEWALGGIACESPLIEQTSPTSDVLTNFSGTMPRRGVGSLNTHSLSSEIDPLKTGSKPIMLKVYKSRKIGQGSMRRAYKAEVKVKEDSGRSKIVEYVAKIRYNDSEPSINNHATDALMYQAGALLLSDFKKRVMECRQLKARSMDWADGNNSEYGILRFIEGHECNQVCEELKLAAPEQIYHEMMAKVNQKKKASKRKTQVLEIPDDKPQHLNRNQT
ncbi:hypothetical protein PSTT_11400, partial [Puccinia striiformis]